MGKVFLVGAGPGNPELLTVKALRILERADVVVYDRLVSPEILALAERAELVDGGKRHGEQQRIQDEINHLMVSHARAGRTVARLKAGDPMIFARGAEEWEYLLRHGIEVEIVPGVSSALAVPSLAGIPPTCRGVAASFAVIAGHRESFMRTDWSQYASIDTLIILMGVENREYIAESPDPLRARRIATRRLHRKRQYKPRTRRRNHPCCHRGRTRRSAAARRLRHRRALYVCVAASCTSNLAGVRVS